MRFASIQTLIDQTITFEMIRTIEELNGRFAVITHIITQSVADHQISYKEADTLNGKLLREYDEWLGVLIKLMEVER